MVTNLTPGFGLTGLGLSGGGFSAGSFGNGISPTGKPRHVTGTDAFGQPVFSDQLYYISMSYRINGAEHPTYAVNPGYEETAADTPAAAVSPTQTPVAPTPAPPAPPPHLQFSPTTIGTQTFLTRGRCRLPGQPIWIDGLTSQTSELTTSLITIASAYCEPLDPTEDIYPYEMSVNGVVFYNYAQGGVIDVPGVSTTDMASLRACIANMRVYKGAEDQLPDSLILAAVPTAPAYRGLRYIVFPQFPASVGRGGSPNIQVEWRLHGDPLLNVADIFVAVGARRGLTVQVVGIPDTCYGWVSNSTQSALQNFIQHRDAYNFQILDGDPVTIKRAAVNGSLTINQSYTAATDLIRTVGPAISVNRVDPTTLPKAVEIQYIDPAAAYDRKVQPARHDGDTTATATLSFPVDFVIDKNTARIMAFDALYRIRNKAMNTNFELFDNEPEIGDVLQITSDQGILIVLVEQQTFSKRRTNEIKATKLLTAAGTVIAGDSGNSSVPASIDWPETINGIINLVTNNSRILSSSPDGIAMNTAPPSRQIPSSFVYTNASFTAPADAVQDVGYSYIIEGGNLLRLSKQTFEATVLTGLVALSTAKQLATYSGYLFFTTDTDFATSAPLRLWIMDLANYGVSGLSSVDLIADPGVSTEGYICTGLCVRDTDVVISTVKYDAGAISAPTLYVVGCVSLAVSTVALTHNLGRAVAYHNIAYFLPATSQIDLAAVPGTATQFFGAMFDGVTVTYFDVRDDTLVSNASQSASKPWVDGSYLCFIANFDLDAYSDIGPINNPYMARFDLTTLASVGGINLAELFVNFTDDVTYAGQFLSGQFFNGNHYIAGIGADSRYTGGIYAIVDQTITAAFLYPTLVTADANDNFDLPFYIVALDTLAGSSISASKQVGEPDHAGNAGGASLWWLFVPTTSGDYTVDATASSFTTLLAVYDGATLATLSERASAVNATVTFYGRAGTQYRIAVDGFDGASGSVSLSMSDVTVIGTDDEEDALMLDLV